MTNLHISDITPPKNVLDKNTCLVENHCVPMALLHFGTNESCDNTNLLREEFLAKISTHKAAIWAATKSRFVFSLERFYLDRLKRSIDTLILFSEVSTFQVLA